MGQLSGASGLVCRSLQHCQIWHSPPALPRQLQDCYTLARDCSSGLFVSLQTALVCRLFERPELQACAKVLAILQSSWKPRSFFHDQTVLQGLAELIRTWIEGCVQAV